MAYSNSRYRHSPNLITHPQKIASIQTFPEIDAIEEIEPIYGFTSLTQKEQTYNRLQNNKITETFLSNYNDPKELNSYIDALTNREAVSEKFGEVWGTASTLSGTASILSFIGAAALGVAGIFTGGATLPAAATLAKIGAIAAIPSIPAAIDVTIEKNLKPLFAGKPKEAGLNLLMNLGETVDVVANPIKGLIQEGSEGFIKGTGLSDAGRVNYNYDTGSVITDMALELITDPLNWISFGGAAVIKTGTKTLSRALTEDIVNNAVRATNAQITTEGLNIGTEGAARIFKTVSNATAKLAKDTLNINNKLDKEAQTTFVRTSIQRALVNALKKEVPTLTNTQISDILKQVTRNTRNGRYQKSAYTHIQNITLDQLSTDVLKGISAMQYYTDSFQNRLIKNSLFSSGFGIGMDLFKSNFDNIKTWMSNLTLNKLKPHNLFNENKGVDITRWDEVKAFWEVCSEYTNALTNEISPRDLDSLYMLLSEQLTRDKQLIKEILDTYNLNPIKQAGALDGIFKQLYGVEFREYIAQLKYINSVENNKYTEFIDYAEYIDKNILQTAYAKSSKVPIKTNAQLYSSKSLESFTKKQSKLVENISKVFSKKDININTNVDKLYVLKESNTYINDLLVNDPAISTAINEITSSEGVGIFLQKIKDDINAYNPEASAEILDAVNIIERAGSTFANLKELHNNIAGLILPKIQGVSDSNFKRYIIDQIYGMYKPIDTLLIEFDSITMPALMRNIEVYLKDKNFKVNDYPGLATQIAEVYKRFLQAQQRANNTYTNTAIVQDFTTSIEFLLERYPQFANEFTNIRQANIAIKTLLKNVKNTNIDLFNNVFADYNTIFNITNTRKLSDIGLALRTLAEHDNLKYFNLPKNSNSATIAFAQRFGQTVNKYKQSIQQYYTYKDTKFLNNINIIYNYIIKNMVENSTDKIQYLSKEILKQDSITQLAILMAYKKYISQNKLEFNKFKNILNALVGRNKKLYNTIMYPDKFFITDFAWDAMKQSEWIAKKAFNEDLINGITAYDNLSTISSKITNDFKTIRDELSKNNLDTPKRLQQERFIKVASKYNKLLDFFEKYYNSLFDKELATKEIEELRDVLNNFPELNEKYSTLVDELEAYWRGEKTFQQSDKANAQLYNQARMDLIQEYTSKNKGLRPDEEAMQIINARLYNEFGSQGIIDEFTPFWEKIKEMNEDYVIAQRKTVTEDIIKKYLSNDNFTTYGEHFLDFLTNPNFKNPTQMDFELYVEFIKNYIAKNKNKLVTTENKGKEIPYNLIPAYLRNLDFKYYYEVLGIEDPRLVYLEINNDLKGWHKRGLNKISAVISQSSKNFKSSFEDITNTFKHESLHNIMDRLLDDQERVLFRQAFKQRFINQFGIQAYNDAFAYLYRLYAEDYKLPKISRDALQKYATGFLDPKHTALIEEELMAFTLDKSISEIRAYYINNNLPTFLNNISDENLENLSNDIFKYLIEIAQNKQIDTKFKQTFAQHTTDKSINFEGVPIKIITPWDPVRKQQELNKAIYNATDINSKDAFYKLFNLSSEELMQELAYRHRFITFKEEDINDKILKNLFKEFKNKNENKYIHFIYDAPTQRYWIVLDKSQEVMMDGRKVYLNGNLITRPRVKKQFNELQQVDNLITDPENPGITKLFNELDDSLFELTGSRLGDSQGEHFSKEMLEQVYEQMPDNVKTLLPEIDKLTDKQYFNSFIYNESVLGKTSSKASLGLYSGNLIVNMRNAVVQAQLYLKPKIEYVNTVFNSILSIASPNSVWKNFTDKELLEALQQTREYKLIALVYDKKYGTKVREIYPTNESAIAKARELGAVIVPLQTYKDMYNVVNHRLGSSGFAKLWNRIMYTYKFGYLIRPGAWIRNFIDTNLKSILEMGGEYKSYLEQSHRILNEYYNIRDYVQIRSEDGILKNEAIKEFFDLGMNNYLTYEQYLELNKTFFSQGVSGNIMADLYVDTDSDLWQSFTNITGKIIDSVNRTENYNRLAVYLYNLDKGMDTTSALARLSKVHFDYSFKNKTEQLLDMVFPFTTFTLRNYSYWIEMIEKHPWILANYAHLMAPHWDFQDYTPEQLATDYTAQNQILNGQLKLAEFEDKRIIFKANPSIQDAIDLFSDPINNVYEKLAAPISVPLNLTIGEYTQPTNLIPILGPAIQSLKSMQNTGSPLPSAIAVTVNYNNSNYNGINGYKDKQYYRPNATKNVVYDSYKTKGITAYRTRMYPIVDIAFEVKSRYTTNVYNRIKNRVKQDVYKGIRYRIRTDTNRFR